MLLLRTKDLEIILELENNDMDICALPNKKKDQSNLQMTEYVLIYSERPKYDKADSGVGLLVL